MAGPVFREEDKCTSATHRRGSWIIPSRGEEEKRTSATHRWVCWMSPSKTWIGLPDDVASDDLCGDEICRGEPRASELHLEPALAQGGS